MFNDVVMPLRVASAAVAQQVKILQRLKVPCERFNVYFTPNKTLMCEGVLGDEGVLELCELGEFRLSLVPLEVDVVTMELDRNFRECKLEGNNSSLQGTSVALLHPI